MVNKLNDEKVVIGQKQTLRAISKNEVKKVYISKDADKHVTKPIADACENSDIEIVYFDNMKELGASCGISVNAAAAAVLK